MKEPKKQSHEGTQARKAREHVRLVDTQGTLGKKAREARNLAHS